jgi:hypothetical protein
MEVELCRWSPWLKGRARAAYIPRSPLKKVPDLIDV